ncbi:MAG: CDP-diacylglycerol--glycerol-3-phosphate 3-phosphatidyltransferase [Chlamydia sp.]
MGGPTLLTVANFLTLLRIFISPVFLLVYLEYRSIGIVEWCVPYVLLFLLSALELSDALDGYIARKYNQVTDLGKVLDPMADSISRISIFLTFTQPPVSLPLLLVFVFIYRDSVISTLRTVCALRGYALAARSSGKIKAVIQGISTLAITSMLIPYSMGSLSQEMLTKISILIVGLCCAIALYSGFEYLSTNFHYVQKALTNRSRRAGQEGNSDQL